MPKVVIFSQSCKGFEECGICSFVCPKNVFNASKHMNRLGYVPAEIENEDACTGCQNCMIYCPDFAIAVEKDSDKSTDRKEATIVSAYCDTKSGELE